MLTAIAYVKENRCTLSRHFTRHFSRVHDRVALILAYNIRVKLQKRLPSIRDVAKAAGVSPMTVSRVLNSPHLVARPTRERVQAAIRDLGYVVNELARQIGTGRRPYISILAIKVATTPYSVDITLAVEQVAREHGWRTYLVNAFTHDPSVDVLDHVLALRPEGVILATVGHHLVNVNERLIRAGVVLVNCQTTQKGVASYVPDDEQGQYDGVCKLLEKGYRRPVCIHLPERFVAKTLRLKGMQRAFQHFKVLEKNQTHFVLDDEPAYMQCVQFLDEAMAKRPRPDCVICGNDRVAFVAYQHLLSRGLRIPKDIGVLGFDNMVGVADLFLPPLSTIRLPHEEMGRAAALHIIRGRKRTGIFRLPCAFIERASF
jgi:DNA-binding LacI/PurR family transcriptional regulator